ncbi:MEKHLA domain-containing protein [bacterium]|nr:MEKHLA domain-containing protein [candidate division CSSED10-310 bacterium]
MNAKQSHFTSVVINNDAAQLHFLCGLLKSEGITVQAFCDAESALTAMNPANPPGLIVTDLSMPGLDGWRFCRLLRSAEYKPFNPIPILVVSPTFSGDHTERIAIDIGADAFLSAPVDGHNFLKLAQMLLTGKKSHHKPRVLIVEDDQTMLTLLRKAFISHGWHADSAATGITAIATFKRNHYDAAILDAVLPDGSGDSLLDAFRTQPDCVCLIIASDPSQEQALSWMKRGAAAYLRKPFHPAILIELCIRTRRERNLLRAEALREERTRKLRESEAFYRMLFNSVNDAVLVHKIDPDGTPGKFIAANRVAIDRLGYSLDEIQQLTPRDISLEESFQQLVKARSEIASKGTTLFETIHLTRSGHRIPVESQVSVLEFADQRVAVSVARDLSERRQAEEQLRESEEKFRFLVNHSCDLIWMMQENGIFSYVSPSWKNILGYEPADGNAKVKGTRFRGQC